MGLDKKSLASDGVGDLYRAALYLAKGSKQMAVSFLQKAQKKIGNLDKPVFQFLNNPGKSINKKRDNLYWAEKILDNYKKLKFNYTRKNGAAIILESAEKFGFKGPRNLSSQIDKYVYQ